MKVFKKLEIISINDPDTNGTWFKDDVEQEMSELGLVPGYDNWIEYILSHFDFPSYVIDALANDDVYGIKFRMDNVKVTVNKS